MIRIAIVLAMLIGVGHAATKRIAVVVGNNVGNGGQTALHYAESDAAKVGRVLTELGGVAPDDLFLLQGKSVAAVTETLALAKRRIAALRKDPTNRIVLMFYFSGHSDGIALELGRDRLTFAELRRWLAAAGADVRVALVDSCKSGALLAAKGGTPGQGFQIRLTDDLVSTGEALLTSSAANEIALESREIGGSFFTHHFVSGLRGAADTSGDGRVTLSEAYQYAYTHTIVTTGDTVVGTQHPTYDYRLSGQGELVLADLATRSATLVLPRGFDRILVIDLARGQVTAEVTSAPGPIAVAPGAYAVRAARAGKSFGTQVVVAINTKREVRADELTPVASLTTVAKGDAHERPWSLFVGGGVSSGVADDLGVLPSVRARLDAPMGLSLAITASSRRGAGYRETSALALVGFRLGVARERWTASAGIEVGGGFVVQSQIEPAAYSGVFSAGLVGGASIAVVPRVSVALDATLPAALLRRDDRLAVIALPAAWLGIAITL